MDTCIEPTTESGNVRWSSLKLKLSLVRRLILKLGTDLDIALHKSAKVISMTCLNASSKGS